MDREALARNALALLQADPKKYKTFGFYWWPIKVLLKDYYDTDNLYLLGDYMDKSALSKLPKVSADELLGMALNEHRNNAIHGTGMQTLFDPEGEPYVLYDEDAGM